MMVYNITIVIKRTAKATLPETLLYHIIAALPTKSMTIILNFSEGRDSY
jgi:hypothetical protein